MQLDRDPAPALVIRSFSPGSLRVGDRDITTSVILTPPDQISVWSPPVPKELSIDHFAGVLAQKPEMILLGTGSRQIFPPAQLSMMIMRAGVGFEIMDTAAACRTFNVLVSEGRQISASLYLR